jgi:tetratricopeptide (TPR) repeat protein
MAELRVDTESMTQQKNDEELFAAAPIVASVEPIRSYRLLQEIGEGGCGIAYLAEQLAPIKRQVAIKVIKPGMDTGAVVARFEAERQLLALMDHPNVAKVFDAGSTAAGRPYFVMELVRGIDITQHCNLMCLSIAERLKLFVQVCQAIQHAHHKGVLHRDIKPSNVLVSMHDGVPLVKVIDFGIARATQGPLGEYTCHTAFDQFLGTPAYISPEQTELTQRHVDTRSDIYSLGVLLYELLTGCTPLDTRELLRSSLDEMRRRIREQEPPTPSTRLKSMRRPSKELRGDLDWIVMRCLEKEPVRRYQSVGDVISDLRRYLSHEPIEARPPGALYLLRKFVRRNRAACGTLLALAAFLVALVVNLSIQGERVAAERDRTEQEGKRAQQTAEFIFDTLSNTEPFDDASTGRPEIAQELLDRTGRWLLQDQSQDVEIRSRLLESVGRAYRRREQFPEAIPFLRKALEVRKTLSGGTGDATSVSILVQLAICLRSLGDLAGAQQMLDDGSALVRVLGQEHSMLYAQVLTNHGRVQLISGRPDAANAHYDAALALIRDLRGPRDVEIAAVLVEQVAVFTWQDRMQEAEHAARMAVDIYNASYPKLHPDRLAADIRLAEALRLRSKFAEASALFAEALAATRKLFGENSGRATYILDSMAKIRWAQGRLVEAESLVRQAIVMQSEVYGLHHASTGYSRTALAAIQIARHEYVKAESELRAALAVFASALPPDHPYVSSAEYYLGEVMLATHRPKDAERYFESAMNRSQRADEPAWRVARSATGLGEALYRQGRADEAEPYLIDSYRVLAADRNADEGPRAASRERIVRFYTEQAQHDRLPPSTTIRTGRT